MAIFRQEYRIKGKRVTIRNAEPEDAQTIIDLIQKLDSETLFLAREPGEFSMTVDRERAYIESRKGMPNYRFAVAEAEGRIIASSDAFYQTRSRYRHIGEIAVGVLESHWGAGIGRAMVEEDIEWLHMNGVEKVQLTVDTKNYRAIMMYMHMGFTIDGVLSRERKLANGAYRDAYMMSLTFEA